MKHSHSKMPDGCILRSERKYISLPYGFNSFNIKSFQKTRRNFTSAGYAKKNSFYRNQHFLAEYQQGPIERWTIPETVAIPTYERTVELN